MLKNLDTPLFESVKIIDKNSGQIFNNTLRNDIKYLRQLGVDKPEDKINSFFEEAKYDYVNDKNLSDNQRHYFAQVHNAIVFAMASSIKNVNNEDQKQVPLETTNISAKACEGDTEIQAYIKDIRMKNGECINVHKINYELINMMHNKVKSDMSLRSEIIQTIIENFEILLNNKGEYRGEFIEFSSENDEIISSQIIREEVCQKVIELKSTLNQTQESKIEIIKHPVNAIKSFIARIGCQKRKKKSWIEKISEKQISIQSLY